MQTAELTLALSGKDLIEQLHYLAGVYPGQVVFSTSLGQEDQVITDIIARNKIPIRIFTLDTGRLFNETYELIDRTRARYKIPIEVFFPQSNAVEKLVTEKGFTSFYESVENRKECCHIRKVEPLNRALDGAEIWITGLRSGQSSNRQQMALLEWAEDRQLHKFNPLINWSFDEMMEYIKNHNVPYNPLHDKGFVSIGCLPCTRAIEPGEDARAGRWWWEESQKECGLHERK
jgi:phosphoadenosine phosphosulfate reductase